MSSILKALQKLERDKETRKTREPDISNAIKMSSHRDTKHSAWLVPFLLFIVASVSILVTFSLMGGFSSDRQSMVHHTQQPFNQQQSPQERSRPEATANSQESTGTAAKTSIIERSPDPVVKKPGAAKVPSLPVPSLAPAQADTEEQSTPLPQSEPEDQISAPSRGKPALKKVLKINGIAWRQDSASRIAVVNGSSVSEGSSIDGAKVERIFPDKVRFSKDGNSFDVTLEHEVQH